MKISEIKQQRVINRASQNFDEFGNRIYNQFESEFDFNLHSDENYSLRLFAKVVDIFPISLIFYYLLHQNIFFSFLYSIPIVIVLNSILEWKTGQSLGKKIFKLKVIDDYGNFPSYLKSIKRNVLCLINLFPTFYDMQSRMGVWFTAMKFNMQLNNEFCTTYVIREKIYRKLKSILENNSSDISKL